MQNRATLINLIKAVKKYPQLYINLTQNCDDLKEWNAVAQECKITEAEAQHHWNLLLIEYVEYLRNIQDFSLAHHMDFLQPYFFTMNNSENIDEIELLKAIDNKGHEENNGSYIEQAKNEDYNLISVTGQEEIKDEQSDKKRASSKNYNDDIEFKPASDSSVISQNNSFPNLSSLELIFLGYAKQLQKMPLHLQLKTKRKIAEMMDEAELQMMN